MHEEEREACDLIKVVSFNLKREGFGKKNSWTSRKELVAAFIEQSGAAVIGVQELLPQMKRDMQELLENYSVIGCGRYRGKKSNNDEHSDIIINNNMAEFTFCKTFWLSKKPEKSGSRGLLAMFPRICTMAEIYLKELDRTIRVYNTHFDHISRFARVVGVRVILDYMSRYQAIDPMPFILMGDLNAKPDSYPIRILRHNMHFHQNIHLNDVYEKSGNLHNTYHRFGGKIHFGKQPIDYIFVSDDFEVMKTEFATDSEAGRYPSDHFPVVATLQLKP